MEDHHDGKNIQLAIQYYTDASGCGVCGRLVLPYAKEAI